MKFDKVKIEHITLALQDFKEKGFQRVSRHLPILILK